MTDGAISAFEKRFITDFIASYRGKPCLWNRSSPDYNNKPARKVAILEILQLMRAFVPEATTLDVKRKINALRCCYRLQLVNMMTSRPPYQPTLWCFDMLQFLRVGAQQNPEDDSDNDDPSSPKRIKREPDTDTDDDCVEVPVVAQPTATASDDSTGLAMIWAQKLRDLPRKQRLFAERAVNEIVFRAELGALTVQSLQQISSILSTSPDNSANI